MPEAGRSKQSVSPARRHFLALTAATTARIAATSALAMAVISSPAQAKNSRGGGNNGRGNGGRGGGGNNGKVHCFLKGTRILTSQGELPIEDLRIGDLVVTVRGEAVPIKWIGRHLYKKSGSSWPKSVTPIRVSCGAIDERTPHRDLYLSPAHALFIDGFLMPVEDLVNGTSIVPALPPGVEIIEYFHIVLDTHEVILAEGAPAETFLIKRGKEYERFTNFIEYERLYQNEPRSMMTPFASNVGGDREHLKALLRLGVSSLIGLAVNDPLQRAYDRIAARAEEWVA